MTSPVLSSWQDGIGVVGADNFNSFTQYCVNFAQLRGFVGNNYTLVYVLGGSAPDDGLQGPFYYNELATGADDGLNVLQPSGVTTGRWIRVSTVGTVTYTPRTPVNDVNYAIAITDEWVSYTALTAERTATLPLCSAATAGQIIAVGDESGNCSLSVPIQVITQGTNKFNATASSFLITSPYSYVEFRNNGSNLWIVHQ